MEAETILTAEEILRRLKVAGVPQAVIAKKLAIAPSAVSNLFKGGRQLKLHEAVTLMSLLPSIRKPMDVPVIGMAGAGRWLEAIEEATQRLSVPADIDAKARFAVQVVGSSMNLVLPEGSFALVNPDDKRLYSGKLYLLRNEEGEATIKRYRTDPARFEPVSSDPEYQPFELGEFDFRVIGRVTAGMQKF